MATDCLSVCLSVLRNAYRRMHTRGVHVPVVTLCDSMDGGGGTKARLHAAEDVVFPARTTTHLATTHSPERTAAILSPYHTHNGGVLTVPLRGTARMLTVSGTDRKHCALHESHSVGRRLPAVVPGCPYTQTLPLYILQIPFRSA